jgi:hypothetical protein
LGLDGAVVVDAAEVLRLLPDFSVRAFLVGKSYKETTDQGHLAGSLRHAGLPD